MANLTGVSGNLWGRRKSVEKGLACQQMFEIFLDFMILGIKCYGALEIFDGTIAIG